MFNRIYAISLLLVLILLQSCATLNLAAPDTTEDKIMAGYASVGAMYTTISDLAKRHAISRELGLRMIARADDAKALLDNASVALSEGSEDHAASALAFAVTILTALEQELKAKEVANGPTIRTDTTK